MLKYFFKNIGIRQTIIKNTFWLGSSELVSRLLEFIIMISVIRALGSTEFGKFTFALSLVSIFVFFFELGISDITIRELSSDKEFKKDYNAIFSLKILLDFLTLAVISLAALLITRDASIRLVIIMLGIFVILNELFYFIYAFLRAFGRMEIEAMGKVVRSVIMMGFVFFVLYGSPSIQRISYSYVLANLIVFFAIVTLFHFKVHPIRLYFDKNVSMRIIRISWPWGLSIILSSIFVNIDSVIMGIFNQMTQVGYYNAARKLVGFTIIPATIVSASFYPILSMYFKESSGKLQRIWNFYLELMIITAVPLVVGGLALAPRIIHFIYGTDFSASIIILQILIFVAGINFLCYPYILMLIVAGKQKKNLLITFIVAAVNISLNLFLIPIYSFYGAAAACVAANVLFLALLIVFSQYCLPISIFNKRLFRVSIITVIASSIMFFIVSLPIASHYHVLFAILTGVLVYTVAFLGLFKLLWTNKAYVNENK